MTPTYDDRGRRRLDALMYGGKEPPVAIPAADDTEPRRCAYCLCVIPDGVDSDYCSPRCVIDAENEGKE